MYAIVPKGIISNVLLFLDQADGDGAARLAVIPCQIRLHRGPLPLPVLILASALAAPPGHVGGGQQRPESAPVLLGGLDIDAGSGFGGGYAPVMDAAWYPAGGP